MRDARSLLLVVGFVGCDDGPSMMEEGEEDEGVARGGGRGGRLRGRRGYGGHGQIGDLKRRHGEG